ncbi:MarR family transcriptional regulator [Pseudonocardia sp. KRD-184]|uniref:MarR family transcriptional regulator n=1 Tax=Pseudonocardia oceani TaxID=2792013 RepID=A0ABS6U7Y3_9PSEU|nr:MarR family transcriptional regulator [Pseudonocardia oceani]MBW0091455.1 MarR family transcriptional regulator [Pseudonocardia oceani]MBW0099676.1 MarR family transcriptional regulator [Pseudonocardia oceani]MBW0112367.1 MarR family transcriptional regulator [Pseudonocardia oceani]MBW0125599.1 MarR family transcriptional regulator [Pseudonocardia oceani]MBW0128316.1 MarR family transcriptional regulator [Pseudonocardia oceani]
MAGAGTGGASPDDAAHDEAVQRLEREISLLLRRSRSVLRTLATRLHPDVDAASYAVLLAIARSSPLRLVDLAEEFGLDKSTMSRQISSLLALGLLRRRPDPEDGRAFLLELSDGGRERLEEVSRARHEEFRSRLASWSADDVGTLADGLTRLATSLAPPEARL